MFELLFFKICFAALAKNSIDPEGYIRVPYELDIGYQFSREKDIKMAYSKVVNNCITKEGFKGQGDHDASEPATDSKFLVRLKRVGYTYSGSCKSNNPEDYSEFPYVNEYIKIFITKDEINDVFKNGKTVMIKIGDTKNFDYNRVSIFISPFAFGSSANSCPIRSYVKEKIAYYNNGANSYIIFFENLIKKHYLTLSNGKKETIQNELKKIATCSESEFKSKYGDKMLLLTNTNFVHLKGFYKLALELFQRTDNATDILEELIRSITPIYPKLNLDKYMPVKEKRRWFIADHEDLYSRSITFGILTDLLNIMRFTIDKNEKFQIYELYDTEKDVSLNLVHNFKFTFDNAKEVTKDNIKILTNINSRISNFTNHALNDALYLEVNLKDIVEMNYQAIRVNIDFNNRKLTTNWVSVTTEPFSAANLSSAFTMPSRRNNSAIPSQMNQHQSDPNFMPSRRTAH